MEPAQSPDNLLHMDFLRPNGSVHSVKTLSIEQR